MEKDLEEHIIDLELQLHTKGVRSSFKELDRLLHDDFREIGSSGKYYCKSDIVAALAQEGDLKIEAEDFEVRSPASNTLHVIYKSKLIGSSGSIESISLRSSIWCKCNDQWKMYFHQGTNL